MNPKKKHSTNMKFTACVPILVQQIFVLLVDILKEDHCCYSKVILQRVRTNSKCKIKNSMCWKRLACSIDGSAKKFRMDVFEYSTADQFVQLGHDRCLYLRTKIAAGVSMLHSVYILIVCSDETVTVYS